MFGDSLVHWLGEHVKDPLTLTPNSGPYLIHFTFFGKRGGKLDDVPVQLSQAIQERGDLPHFILIHVGSNDVANSQIDTKSVMIKIQHTLNSIISELFEAGVYTAGAHRFQGLVWSDILPRYRWTKFKDQKAAEGKRKRVNAAANDIMERAGFWSLKHDNFKAHLKVNYRIPDPTHLSATGNQKFYTQLENYLQNIIHAQRAQTFTKPQKYKFYNGLWLLQSTKD